MRKKLRPQSPAASRYVARPSDLIVLTFAFVIGFFNNPTRKATKALKAWELKAEAKS